ncbi:MAG: alpha/beta hydrolase [Planctomycetaceae bacterium]
MPISFTLPPCRSIRTGLLTVGLLGLLTPVAFAQKGAAAPAKAPTGKATKGPTTEVLRAENDGYPLHLTYYEASPDANPTGVENAAVVLLLHGEGGSRLIWDKSSAFQGQPPFAEKLNALGYAVVSVDLRKHGESVPEGQSTVLDNNDFTLMAYNDLPAIRRFLLAKHEAKKLNIGKIGIIASDATAPVALQYAAMDWEQEPFLDGPGGEPGTPRGQDVRSIVLLSPALTAGRLNALQAANFLKTPAFGIGFVVIAGTRDAEDKGGSQKFHQIFMAGKQNADRVAYVRPNTNARGTDLLGNPAAKIESPILDFLDKHLKQVDVPWQTRKSRYDRDEETPAKKN